jgi:hypothetical protein
MCRRGALSFGELGDIEAAHAGPIWARAWYQVRERIVLAHFEARLRGGDDAEVGRPGVGDVGIAACRSLGGCGLTHSELRGASTINEGKSSSGSAG